MAHKPKPRSASPTDDTNPYHAAYTDSMGGLLWLDQDPRARQMPSDQRSDLVHAAAQQIRDVARLETLSHTITLAKANASRDALFDLFNHYHSDAERSLKRFQTLKLLVKDLIS